MFDDVRDARVVLGQRAERDAEGLVLVGPFEPRELRAVLGVFHAPEATTHLRKRRAAFKNESMPHVTRLHLHFLFSNICATDSQRCQSRYRNHSCFHGVYYT